MTIYYELDGVRDTNINPLNHCIPGGMDTGTYEKSQLIRHRQKISILLEDPGSRSMSSIQASLDLDH